MGEDIRELERSIRQEIDDVIKTGDVPRNDVGELLLSLSDEYREPE